MWFSGLRGAVAFALAVTFLDHPDFNDEIKRSIFATTVMVIVVTVLLFGGLTPYMLRWLKIVPEESHDGHSPVPTNPQEVEIPPEDAQHPITQEDLEQPLMGWLYRLDAK
jgi:solute carrier family 9 (sodium/hydrogen exchanger), member 8